jgi:secondary thiamine-phosphate synthase enzyme
MKILNRWHHFSTQGFTEIIDLTPEVQSGLTKTKLQTGNVLVSAIGSTTGISSLEYEPGLVNQDIHEMLDKIAPYGKDYLHNQTWGDDNGAAHLRSFLIGTSAIFPFEDGRLLLGTWQQIVFCDFDTRPRERKVLFQYIGI